MTDAQTIRYATDPNRMAAAERLLKAKRRIEELAPLPIQTVLTYMPQALKDLLDAYEALTIAEAQAELKARKEEAHED